MTDARGRLAQGLEILMARPYNYWHLKEAADAIAAFVEGRVRAQDQGGTEAARSGREQSPPAGAASVQPAPAAEWPSEAAVTAADLDEDRTLVYYALRAAYAIDLPAIERAAHERGRCYGHEQAAAMLRDWREKP